MLFCILFYIKCRVILYLQILRLTTKLPLWLREFPQMSGSVVTVENRPRREQILRNISRQAWSIFIGAGEAIFLWLEIGWKLWKYFRSGSRLFIWVCIYRVTCVESALNQDIADRVMWERLMATHPNITIIRLEIYLLSHKKLLNWTL